MRTLRIDIVSDVVCPWCIIGYKRLQKALQQLSTEITADIHWHPFELNPTMPEGGETYVIIWPESMEPPNRPVLKREKR